MFVNWHVCKPDSISIVWHPWKDLDAPHNARALWWITGHHHSLTNGPVCFGVKCRTAGCLHCWRVWQGRPIWLLPNPLWQHYVPSFNVSWGWKNKTWCSYLCSEAWGNCDISAQRLLQSHVVVVVALLSGKGFPIVLNLVSALQEGAQNCLQQYCNLVPLGPYLIWLW